MCAHMVNRDKVADIAHELCQSPGPKIISPDKDVKGIVQPTQGKDHIDYDLSVVWDDNCTTEKEHDVRNDDCEGIFNGVLDKCTFHQLFFIRAFFLVSIFSLILSS